MQTYKRFSKAKPPVATICHIVAKSFVGRAYLNNSNNWVNKAGHEFPARPNDLYLNLESNGE